MINLLYVYVVNLSMVDTMGNNGDWVAGQEWFKRLVEALSLSQLGVVLIKSVLVFWISVAVWRVALPAINRGLEYVYSRSKVFIYGATIIVFLLGIMIVGVDCFLRQVAGIVIPEEAFTVNNYWVIILIITFAAGMVWTLIIAGIFYWVHYSNRKATQRNEELIKDIWLAIDRMSNRNEDNRGTRREAGVRKAAEKAAAYVYPVEEDLESLASGGGEAQKVVGIREVVAAAKDCDRCGLTHRNSEQCYARNAVCYNCQKKGHYKRRCPYEVYRDATGKVQAVIMKKPGFINYRQQLDRTRDDQLDSAEKIINRIKEIGRGRRAKVNAMRKDKAGKNRTVTAGDKCEKPAEQQEVVASTGYKRAKSLDGLDTVPLEAIMLALEGLASDFEGTDGEEEATCQ